MAQYILPNAWAPIIVISTASLGVAIIAESSLSFLGLGPPPPNPTWGSMLSGSARSYMSIAPWLALAPGIAITIIVLAFNLLGDALRDVLDPRLRGGR
jgi:peptide/nickel transport system permease protein